MRRVLRSTDINDEACYIARTNCLPEHRDLIGHYWYHNFRKYIKYNLYKEKTKISENSIMEALTK